MLMPPAFPRFVGKQEAGRCPMTPKRNRQHGFPEGLACLRDRSNCHRFNPPIFLLFSKNQAIAAMQPVPGILPVPRRQARQNRLFRLPNP